MNPLRSFCASLPYEFNALEPILSRETVQYHFIQHHRSCYERTAAKIRGTKWESLSLEELVRTAGVQPANRSLFVLASEAWNHDLYWCSLRPRGGGNPRGRIGVCIERCFGSYATFLRQARSQAAALVGSGWLWVTWRQGRIEVITTSKTDSPLLHGHSPLLAIDLWEHAYYLDYYNARDAYVCASLTRLVDWGSANSRLLAAEDEQQSERRAAFSWLAWGTANALPAMYNSSREQLSPEQCRNLEGIHATR